MTSKGNETPHIDLGERAVTPPQRSQDVDPGSAESETDPALGGPSRGRGPSRGSGETTKPEWGVGFEPDGEKPGKNERPGRLTWQTPIELGLLRKVLLMDDKMHFDKRHTRDPGGVH